MKQSIMLNLPQLKQLNLLGTCPLFDILKAAPNLDDLIIDYDCLKILIDDEPTRDLLRQRIIRLEIRPKTYFPSDSFHRVIHVFDRLRHLCVILNNSKISIQSNLSIIFTQVNIKQLTSIFVNVQLVDEININRQWVVDHTSLTMDDEFIIDIVNGFVILWK